MPRLLHTCILVASLSLAGCVSSPFGRPGSSGSGSLFRPKGAPWTIQCLELQGPNRIQHVEQIAETLKRTEGIKPKNVYVIDHADGFARLYHGTYYRRTDSKTGRRSIPKRMTVDLMLIKQLGAGGNQYYFAGAMVVRRPTPDVGNPEWALSKVDGMYTVQVAAFEPTDSFSEFKEAAAQCCAALREAGYQAFYHHTNACSMVTVGVFGADALVTKEVTTNNYRTVRNFYDAEVEALLNDETLRYHHVNGTIRRVRANDGTLVPVRSRLVKIPRGNEPLQW